MAGTHEFTSSEWIQSGSLATFKSGIVVSESFSVDGTITATSFVGDGSGLTGVGAVFFAGHSSSISQSTPTSQDSVIQLISGEQTANKESVLIETTSSGNFLPNYYAFVKLTDKFETIKTGSESFYTGSNRGAEDSLDPLINDLAPGVHRYLVYGAQTGSGGSTQQVFSTITINPFINNTPTIILPTGSIVGSPLTMSMEHDTDSGSIVAHFTNSFDPNVSSGDFIRIFSASRQTSNPSINSINDIPGYTLTMKHHSTASTNLIATGSINTLNNGIPEYGGNATALSSADLLFTASITSYDTVAGNTILDNTQKSDEHFTIHMVDNNSAQNISSSLAFTMSVAPPPTASVENIRVEFESGSYSGTSSKQFETTILYDDTSTRATRDGLDSKYTSSLVRMAVCADVIEPNGYTATETHFTTVAIRKSSNQIINDSDSVFQYFRFKGGENTASLYHSSNIAHTTDYTEQTESNGYTPFAISAGTNYYHFSNNQDDNANIRHGLEDHVVAVRNEDEDRGKLIVNTVPNIQISDIEVQVESGSFLTATGSNERSASLLYGYTTTFLSSETSSLEGYESSSGYISESVVRLRLLAKVTEPFGPHHTNMLGTITATESSSISKTFQFNTGSGEVHCIESSSVYDSQNRLVGVYTSSWHEFKFNPGTYTFVPTFSSNTNTGIDTDTAVPASVLINSSSDLIVDGLKVELESFPYSSSEGTTSRTETILYGFDSTLTATQADTIGDIWSGSAAVRARVVAKITEPFGPSHFITSVSIDDSQGHSTIFAFHTASQATASSSTRVLNTDGLYQQTYTSSFVDNFTFTQGSYTLEPSVATGSNANGIYAIRINDSSNANLTINNTPPVVYNSPRVEVEALNSGSGEGATSRTTKILHGNTTTENNNDVNDGYPNTDSKNQLTSVRFIVQVYEPFGPHHTSSLVTIGGYGSSHVVNLHTGSSELSASVSQSYSTHGSQSVIYTSSFVPIAMTTGTKNVNYTTIDSQFEGNETITDAGSNVVITVQAPDASTVEVAPNTGSSGVTNLQGYWSSSVELSPYVTFNNEQIRVPVIANESATAPTITSASNLEFPEALNVTFTEDPSMANFSFKTIDTNGFKNTPFTANSNPDNTVNLEMTTNFFSVTKVTPKKITVSATDILNGNGTSGDETFQFYIVPAKPRSMEGQYWSSTGGSSHSTDSITPGNPGISLPAIDGNRKLYAGSLSMGLINYKSGDEPSNPLSFKNVDNIVMAKDSFGGNTNYSMSFTTTTDYNGNYADNDRAFDFGDTGSLVVKVNGTEVVNYNIQNDFKPSNRGTTQDIFTHYTNNGTASFSGGGYDNKGRLILTKVAPFNDVSQSISNKNIQYPNGYQAFSARIEIDEKLREGYNYLEFEHIIDASTTQSFNTFEWYYDDSLTEPTISIDNNPTMSYSNFETQPTFSLSGVSFFNDDVEFLVSFNDRILDLANKTYVRQDNDTDQVMRISNPTSSGTPQLEIKTGSISEFNTFDDISLRILNDNRGLVFDDFGGGNLIPSASSTASIQDLRVKGILSTATNATDRRGVVLPIQFSTYKRNLSDTDSWTESSDVTIPVGRFVDTGSFVASSDTIENFFSEEYRWTSASIIDSSSLNPIDMGGEDKNYTFWLSESRADWNSNTSILESTDLQQHYDGTLRYPADNYKQCQNTQILTTFPVVNPNQIDYSSASGSGDRFYYTALFVGTTGTAQNFTVKVGFDDPSLVETDIFANVFNEQSFDDVPMRIDIKVPGPIDTTVQGNTSVNPGTGWGVITGAGSGTHPKFDNFNASTGAPTITSNEVQIPVTLGQASTEYSQGVVLFRIRFKDTLAENQKAFNSLSIEVS